MAVVGLNFTETGQLMLDGIELPTDYHTNAEKALIYDYERGSNYLKHTLIGDPEVDQMLEECASLDRSDIQRFIHAGMEQDESVLSQAPSVIRDFFESLETPPDWFDFAAARPGIRSFHRNSPLILGGMVGGVLVEGFATNISKSFFLTGRIRDQGVRRLKQNNRHMWRYSCRVVWTGTVTASSCRSVSGWCMRRSAVCSACRGNGTTKPGCAGKRRALWLGAQCLLGAAAVSRCQAGRQLHSGRAREFHADMAVFRTPHGHPGVHPPGG